MKKARQDLTGKHFGRWTVIGPASKKYYLTCRCECGSEKDVKLYHLIDGGSSSCGCLMREIVTDHGLSCDRRYFIWHNMMKRCYEPNHPNYKRYGARGIQVHKRWHDMHKFLEDVGESPSDDHTLDRINNNGNYRPGNVRWATRSQQQRNRQCVRMVTYRGKKMAFLDAVELSGTPLAPNTIWSRFHRHGWPLEKALTTPLMQTPKRRYRRS